MSTAEQIKVIHTLKTRAGLADDDYRALLSRHGVESSRHLLGTQAVVLIAEMRRLPGAGPRPSATRASGRYAPVLRAMWISAHNLGLVRSPRDQAMMSFVTRQTDLSHTRFLTDPRDATRAIEALKAWIKRETGIVWPKTLVPADTKRAVCFAIVERLQKVGAFPGAQPGTAISPADVLAHGTRRGLPVTFGLYRDRDWDMLSADLGRRLRHAMANTTKTGDSDGQH